MFRRGQGFLVWFLPTLFFIFGLVFGWIVWGSGFTRDAVTYDNPPLRNNDGKYKLISPLYACGSLGEEKYEEFRPLKDKIQRLVDEKIYAGMARTASFYFRDLKRGRRAIVNDGEKYFPASLLKIPLLIAYFKKAESEPRLLDKVIRYDGSFDESEKQDLAPKKAVKGGESYTVLDLLRLMIVYSDNKAARLLVANLDQGFLSQVYDDLNLRITDQGGDLDFISIRFYSYFFRIIYNSTYLSREMSEKAMELISQSEFSEGIRAGVPTGIVVANKFGESVIDYPKNPKPVKELHDCGIVYHPDGDYLLCVMTKGDDFDNLATVIQDISRAVYKEVSSSGYSLGSSL